MTAFNIRPRQVRGKKVFRFKYFGLDGQPKYLTHKLKSELEKKVAEKIKEIGFEKTESSQVFFNQANNLWLKHLNYKKSEGRISESTIEEYQSWYKNHLYSFFGNTDIRLITQAKVREFVNHMKLKVENKQIKSDTLFKIFNTLSLIIQHQFDEDEITRNVCKEKNYLKNVFKTKSIPQLLDFEKYPKELMEKIVDSITRPEVKLLCMIMLETACRPSEARALARDSLLINTNIPRLHFNKAVKKHKKLGGTKTINGVRKMVISASLKDKLLDHINQLPGHQEELFLNSKAKYICVEQIIRGVDKALAKSGVVVPIKRKSYIFRHYMATYWAYKGKYKNAIDLAHALGDSDINFVQRTYIKPYGDNQNNVDSSEFQNQQFSWK